MRWRNLNVTKPVYLEGIPAIQPESEQEMNDQLNVFAATTTTNTANVAPVEPTVVPPGDAHQTVEDTIPVEDLPKATVQPIPGGVSAQPPQGGTPVDQTWTPPVVKQSAPQLDGDIRKARSDGMTAGYAMAREGIEVAALAGYSVTKAFDMLQKGYTPDRARQDVLDERVNLQSPDIRNLKTEQSSAQVAANAKTFSDMTPDDVAAIWSPHIVVQENKPLDQVKEQIFRG